MKFALSLAMCFTFASAQEHFFKNPTFYKSKDCTGEADPASALWGFPATDGVVVKPFSVAGAELNGQTIGRCMTGGGGAKDSVMLSINKTMCTVGEGELSLEMVYWGGSTSCEGTGQLLRLIEGKCVETQLGSALFNVSLSSSEICTMMQFLTDAWKGGLRLRGYLGSNCTGLVTENGVIPTKTPSCGAEPQCKGCCPLWNSKGCTKTGQFKKVLTSCRKVAGSWEGGLMSTGYSNDKCTSVDNTEYYLGLPLYMNDGSKQLCSETRDGYLGVSMEADFVAPLTIDTYCKWVELNTKFGVDGFLTWNQFKEAVNAAPTAHPISAFALAVLLLLAVLL